MVLGMLPVVPMTLISAALMVVVSWCTTKPSAAAIARYFPATEKHPGRQILPPNIQKIIAHTCERETHEPTVRET